MRRQSHGHLILIGRNPYTWIDDLYIEAGPRISVKSTSYMKKACNRISDRTFDYGYAKSLCRHFCRMLKSLRAKFIVFTQKYDDILTNKNRCYGNEMYVKMSHYSVQRWSCSQIGFDINFLGWLSDFKNWCEDPPVNLPGVLMKSIFIVEHEQIQSWNCVKLLDVWHRI